MRSARWRKMWFCFFGLFLISIVTEARELKISPSLEQNSSSIDSHDVKFIVESFVGNANWEPGTSNILSMNKNILDYDTKGLKIFAFKGKINVFDTDVFEVEKFSTFSSGNEQKDLMKLRKYNNNSAFEGVNISLRAFLLLKYFYLYDYDFLDALEYQYDYNNFYAKATNNIDAIYWWGENNNGEVLEDYVKLPAKSLLELTTEFKEHRLYILDFKSYFKRFYIDSFQVGYFSTHWVKESFVGLIANDHSPVIQSVLLESDGISVQVRHNIKKADIDLKLRYNYGIDSYVVVSNEHWNANYYSIDVMIDYYHNIFESMNYTIFTEIDAMYSNKWFDNSQYNLDHDTLFTVAMRLGIIF
jgi:hypothetical protein